VIETDRLVLRRWTDADREPFAALNADPEVMRYLGAGPLTRDESDAFVDRIESSFDERGFGLWCVALRDTPNRCLGFTGLAVPSWLPEILPAVEIGWRIARSAWGRGIATEAAVAARAHAFDVLELDQLVAMRHPDNARSGRVMDKLGFVYDHDTVSPSSGAPCSVFVLTREAFRQLS
jgi:RimJ/RimL family protein N-acetyltransferase